MVSFDLMRVHPELPSIDARLVESETRYEMYDGELVYVPPADAPHGERHSKVSALVEAHARVDFNVASDMLTRTSRTSDIAPDVSVYPRAPDPVTGGRQLEQLAFEVVSTQSLSRAGVKAAKLAERGVRRVFAIDVERERALEWSAALDTWTLLDAGAHIEDTAFAAPLPVEALVHAANTDDAVARALLRKRNAVLEEHRASARAEGLSEGLTRGRAQAASELVLDVLAARGIALTLADRARILDEQGPDQLRRWGIRAATCASAAELFAER